MIPLLLASPALAAGSSADIELVRPTFSASALPGGDSARLDGTDSLRLGAYTQYERDPLVLYEFSEEVGAVVANRQTLLVGLAWQPVDRLALRASLPAAAQWGSEVEGFGGDGFGAGDLGVGARVAALDRRAVALAGAADLYLPTGAKDQWMGEASLRAVATFLADVDAGPVGLRAQLGTTLRPPVDTEYDLVFGSEVGVTAAVVYALVPDHVELSTGVVTRTSFQRFFQAGESVAEWIAGGTVAVGDHWTLDAALGRGVASGYGTSQARALVGLTWEKPPKPPPPKVVREEPPPAEPTPDLTEAVLAPEPPPPVALAEVREDQIVIRDPIQFEFGTDHILPASMPTLEAVAGVLAAHPEILHVVIEGHASDEGSYLYNYTLSLSRALAIFKALVDVGVHPDRLSCRAMGEVEPVSPGTDEASLAANRRVVFQIVRRLAPGEPWPDYGPTVRVPWTGDSRPVPPPPPPPAAPPPAPPPDEPVPDFQDALDQEDP